MAAAPHPQWFDPSMPSREHCVLPSLLAARAAATPDRDYLLYEDGKRWTYATRYALARRAAAALRRCGVRAGDKVLVWLPNGPDAVRAWFGANLVGVLADVTLEGQDSDRRALRHAPIVGRGADGSVGGRVAPGATTPGGHAQPDRHHHRRPQEDGCGLEVRARYKQLSIETPPRLGPTPGSDADPCPIGRHRAGPDQVSGADQPIGERGVTGSEGRPCDGPRVHAPRASGRSAQAPVTVNVRVWVEMFPALSVAVMVSV